MIECKIVMPVGDDTDEAYEGHQRLKHRLVEYFGGYTDTTAHGSWVRPDGVLDCEPVGVYIVAVPANADSDTRIVEVALEAGRALKQKAVYVVLTNGEARIIDIAPVIAAEPEPEATGKLPQVCEVWSTRDGSVVAVVDGRAGRAPGFSCVGLHFATVPWRRGHEFVVEPNGRFVAFDIAAHPLDLVQHISSY
jgi:hypothetical protein